LKRNGSKIIKLLTLRQLDYRGALQVSPIPHVISSKGAPKCVKRTIRLYLQLFDKNIEVSEHIVVGNFTAISSAKE
jgi:hypothetical protein